MSESRHFRFEKFEFYADHGMITLIDTEIAGDSSKDPTEYTWSIAPGDFMKRAVAAMIKEPDKYPSRLAVLRKLLNDATEACKAAFHQGDPTQPNVREDVIRHQRKRSIVLPSELPPLAGVNYKLSTDSNRAEDILTKGVSVKPDLVIS